MSVRWTNEKGKTLERIVLTRVMRLNLIVDGIAVGLLFGLGLFLVMTIIVGRGGPVAGAHLGLLQAAFYRYTPSRCPAASLVSGMVSRWASRSAL